MRFFFFLPRVVNAFLLVWASYLLMKVQITAKNSDYGRVRCRTLVISQLWWLKLSHQCISNFNVHSGHLRILLKFRFWFSRSGVGLKILLRNRLPCNALMKHLLNKKDTRGSSLTGRFQPTRWYWSQVVFISAWIISFPHYVSICI